MKNENPTVEFSVGAFITEKKLLVVRKMKLSKDSFPIPLSSSEELALEKKGVDYTLSDFRITFAH